MRTGRSCTTSSGTLLSRSSARRHRLEVVERDRLLRRGRRAAGRGVGARHRPQASRARASSRSRVCLINAHMNPAHERRVARDPSCEELARPAPLALDGHPAGAARVRAHGHDRRERLLRADPAPLHGHARGRRWPRAGFHGDVVLVMHNGGGTMTTDYAKGAPVKTLNSGPAAGVIAGAAVAALVRAAATSCAWTWAARAPTSPSSATASRSSRAPSTSSGACRSASRRIDVISIGAGGGSIAWLDPAGYPRSGPQSAGADPGPACYGKGGTEPTNTDAQLVLGRVSQRPLPRRAHAARRRVGRARRSSGAIAEPLGLERRGAPPRASCGSPTRTWSRRSGSSRSSAASTRASSASSPSAAPGRCTPSTSRASCRCPR